MSCAISEFVFQEISYRPQTTHVQTSTTQISVINESTVLADKDATPAVAALQKHVTNDFRPTWGTDTELIIVPKGT